MAASSSAFNRIPDPPSLNGISALLELISELSLREINHLQMKQRVDGRARPAGTATDDNELALALFADEAASLLNISKDRILNPRYRQDLLDELIAIEETARYDHALALALSEGRPPPPRPPGLKCRQRKREGDPIGLASPSPQSSVYAQKPELEGGSENARAPPGENAYNPV
ncbi:hypothetical protein BD413DRAFT_614362 [Trametes elegans]|nr:hypothetical protein BD413DRAFT_614362 [Trametes elegans]